jgi:Holliday junction DNA helicase RuvA
MYEFFRGRVAHIDASGNLSLEVAGVGYRLRISEQTRAALPLDGSEVVVHARLAVKEDAMDLFGFADPAERAAFDLLTSVTGVGPVVALAICSALGVDDLRRALAGKDVAALKKVKGVGAKSGERIILELHDKVDRIPGSSPLAATGDSTQPADQARDEALRALIALGFGTKESTDTLARIETDNLPAEAYVREALSLLR